MTAAVLTAVLWWFTGGPLVTVGGVYRLAKVDICTILVHIPMLEGKSSMGKFFQIVPMKFRPSTSRLKIPIFAL